MLTLALLVPLTAGDYDLSVAATMTLSCMSLAILNVNHGWPIGAAIAAALVVGAASSGSSTARSSSCSGSTR